jgi:DNA-binding NarL/FixJ family response regulator
LQILVIDDHSLVREGLRQVLKQVDPAVVFYEADSAADALSLITSNPNLDLILLDLGLPDWSGLDTLADLRRDHADIPVVILSGSMESDDVMRSIKGGAAGFIPKSSPAGVMLGAIRVVLAGGVYLPPEILLANGLLWRGLEAAGPVKPADRTHIDAAELGLSDRQAQVLALLVRGRSNKEIARSLDLAEQTVKAHISSVLRLLNVDNRTHAAIVVAQLGIDLDRHLKTPPVR